jgi:hypothetical protein
LGHHHAASGCAVACHIDEEALVCNLSH